MRQLWNFFNLEEKGSTNSSARSESSESPGESSEKLPPLSDGDYEFLFRQLMEGVTQGWPAERAALFFDKLGDRGSPELWLDWLQEYRSRLLGTRSTNIAMANQMMKIGEMVRSLPKWQAVGESIYEIGLQLRLRSQPSPGNAMWGEMTPSAKVKSAPQTSAVVSPPPADPEPPVETVESVEDSVVEVPATPVSVESSQSQISAQPFADPVELDAEYLEQVANLQSTQKRQPEVVKAPAETPKPAAEVTATPEEPAPTAIAQPPEAAPEPALELPTKTGTEAIAPAPEPELPAEPPQSVEEYIKQQPVINLAYTANGQQWTETVSLNQLLEKFREIPTLVAQFSQQMGINSQDPEEIVQAIYQQLYDIHQAHQEKAASSGQGTDEASTLFNRAMQQARTGNYAGAIADWDRALRLQPNNYKAWLNRGNALVMLRQPQVAIESYEKALAIEPNIHDAWGNKGVALLNLKRFEEAIAALDRGISLKPDYHEAWDNLGLALRELGRIDEAIAAFDRAIEINPNDPSALKHQVETLKLRREES
ncbi:tetratricopeptide repeat protein [Roseofilum casamattae]|uniref:Tetratricopeptide repeat protein n=1 Tax=Roseofilum casamattae BLCC-M143 TaxID=3022442 RepID=A0ABT7BUC3_9CYAN|nr:tetratricopeptide repeat protein [Roseofilum casamattae]MDJ1182789.1 tetratricopeptide repeat protein [Roseofilum casamattae BLCC-M143]